MATAMAETGEIAQVLPLAVSRRHVLALGAWFKSTACAAQDGQGYLTRLVGDLDNPEACSALDAAVAHLCDLPGFVPELVVHDLHPDFYSTRLAFDIAEHKRIPVLGVQHHHAHVAAVCAEHGVTGPVLGLGLDGVGLGSDGQAWGGELLKVSGGRFTRLGHLQALKLPGGDRAAREPWRMGAAALHALGRHSEIVSRYAAHAGAGTVAAMLQRDLHCPPTSSMGRLFDAAAGLLGICPVQSFEGEAAIRLQALAEAHGDVAPLEGGFMTGDTLDFRPLLALLAGGGEADYLAALFHATVAAGLAAWVREAATREGLQVVACGGGCFLNRLLLRRMTDLLAPAGIRVLAAQRLSPGDSAISLGQAWVGLHYLQENH